MARYEKKIREYSAELQGRVSREGVSKTIQLSKKAFVEHESYQVSYLEFLYQQSHFIKKKWWLGQGGLLLVLWFLLRDSDSSLYSQRLMGTGSSLFAMIVIPELWKNRRTSSMEIEGAAFYTLRQVYSARMLLFAMVDLVMVTVFYGVTWYTNDLSLEMFAVNFMIPFNVSGCICFHFLASQRNGTEYMAFLFSGVWLIIWNFILSQDVIYSQISGPIWLGGFIFSLSYLVYCIHKANCSSQHRWEVDQLWY